MKILKRIIDTIKTFINNKGVVWIGGLGVLIFILITRDYNWFWGVVTGVLGYHFVDRNASWISVWIDKQVKNIKSKFDK